MTTKVLQPIIFNRGDFTGETGTITPLGPNWFTIQDIDGIWTMMKDKAIVMMAEAGGDTQYLGYTSGGYTVFAKFSCEREDEDPRIAFAQLMYNKRRLI